jgi:uncharacterized integral membrane protein
MVTDPAASPKRGITVTPRMMIAGLIVVLVVFFVILNREETPVSFIFFTARVDLWIALALAALAGFAAGFLSGRRRYTL